MERTHLVLFGQHPLWDEGVQAGRPLPVFRDIQSRPVPGVCVVCMQRSACC